MLLYTGCSYLHLLYYIDVCIQILFLLPLSYVLLDCEYSDLDCEYDDVDYEYGDINNVKQMNCLKMKNHQKCLLEHQCVYGRLEQLIRTKTAHWYL